MSGQSRLRVDIADARGRSVEDYGLRRWLPGAAPSRARGRLTIGLVSDLTMRRLNREFRDRDYPTDVLSFPADEKREKRVVFLGDLAIALGVAGRQARAQGHDLATELKILALHGLLHLLGYDHETDEGRMQRAEERLRRRAGLPAGLISRPATARLRR